jgi:hypothetical protein
MSYVDMAESPVKSRNGAEAHLKTPRIIKIAARLTPHECRAVLLAEGGVLGQPVSKLLSLSIR